MYVYIEGNLYNFPREYIVQQWQHHHKSLANKFFQYIHFFTVFTFYFHRLYIYIFSNEYARIDCICAYSNLLMYAYVRTIPSKHFTHREARYPNRETRAWKPLLCVYRP